jgi:sulfate transport system permease protein
MKLEEYDYAGAAGIAVVFLLASFALLFLMNIVSMRGRARFGGRA